MENFNYIVNPTTNRKVNINTRLGKSIINKYKKITQLGGSNPQEDGEYDRRHPLPRQYSPHYDPVFNPDVQLVRTNLDAALERLDGLLRLDIDHGPMSEDDIERNKNRLRELFTRRERLRSMTPHLTSPSPAVRRINQDIDNILDLED